MAATSTDVGLTLNHASVLAPPSNKQHKYRIASIPADGIGPEVVSAAIEVVQKLSEVSKTFEIEFTHIPWGTAYYKEHGRYVDENVLDVLRSYDATLFGSVGAPGKSSAAFEKPELTKF
jgi:isocitrate/isopropylmalate dehydrogenase